MELITRSLGHVEGAKHPRPSTSSNALRGLIQTLTVITTYKCNAACDQCCFQCSPKLGTALRKEEIIQNIETAKNSFTNLKMVVFSGGECFLLGDDLFDCIHSASSLGLGTRCVTNAFWGKNQAERITKKLIAAGISEMNISTGLDHMQWVPLKSVINASRALVEAGIRTVITVEADTHDSNVYQDLLQIGGFGEFYESNKEKLTLIRNSWIPFNSEHENANRVQKSSTNQRKLSCQQLFSNIVISPKREVISCCGLSFEHIQELKLGSLGSTDVATAFDDMLADTLKMWIHLDGPVRIIEDLIGEEAARIKLEGVEHICHACTTLHKDEQVRSALIKKMESGEVAEILYRFGTAAGKNLKIASSTLQ